MCSEGSGFAVLYRWRVDKRFEQQFRDRWRETTLMFRARHGALGSCLTRDESGNFVAFARWPSEAARSNASLASSERTPFPGLISFEETLLWVEDDLLV